MIADWEAELLQRRREYTTFVNTYATKIETLIKVASMMSSSSSSSTIPAPAKALRITRTPNTSSSSSSSSSTVDLTNDVSDDLEEQLLQLNDGDPTPLVYAQGVYDRAVSRGKPIGIPFEYENKQAAPQVSASAAILSKKLDQVKKGCRCKTRCVPQSCRCSKAKVPCTTFCRRTRRKDGEGSRPKGTPAPLGECHTDCGNPVNTAYQGVQFRELITAALLETAPSIVEKKD